jgi:hypothetical protein
VFAVLVAFIAANTAAYPLYLCQSAAVQWGLIGTVIVQPFHAWLLIGSATLAGLIGHLIADVLTVGGGYPVKVFWPMSSKSYALGVCKADNPAANAALLAAGATAIIGTLLNAFFGIIL